MSVDRQKAFCRHPLIDYSVPRFSIVLSILLDPSPSSGWHSAAEIGDSFSWVSRYAIAPNTYE